MPSGIAVASVLCAAWVAVLVLNVFRTIRMISPKSHGVIRTGPWSLRLTDGSSRMTMHQRAVVAITGLWAMKNSEAIYSTALHDSEGRRLNCQNSYVIEGTDPHARWWSITAYRNYQFIPNELNRYSYNTTNILRTPDNSWRITLSPHTMEDNWIPLGSRSGQLVISLRLYDPQWLNGTEEQLSRLPKIVRVDDVKKRVPTNV